MSFSVRTTDVEFEVVFAILQFCIRTLTLYYTGFFGLAGHGGRGDGIHHTFITLVLFDGFELNLVQ